MNATEMRKMEDGAHTVVRVALDVARRGELLDLRPAMRVMVRELSAVMAGGNDNAAMMLIHAIVEASQGK